jgi:hypothetical protein
MCWHDYHREGGFFFGKILRFRLLLLNLNVFYSIAGCFRSSQGTRSCPNWISRRCHRPRSCRRYRLHVRGLLRT